MSTNHGRETRDAVSQGNSKFTQLGTALASCRYIHTKH